MPRLGRTSPPDYTRHVVQRGHNRRAVLRRAGMSKDVESRSLAEAQPGIQGYNGLTTTPTITLGHLTASICR